MKRACSQRFSRPRRALGAGAVGPTQPGDADAAAVRDDSRDHLVAEDARRLADRDLAVEQMQVGAADPQAWTRSSSCPGCGSGTGSSAEPQRRPDGVEEHRSHQSLSLRCGPEGVRSPRETVVEQFTAQAAGYAAGRADSQRAGARTAARARARRAAADRVLDVACGTGVVTCALGGGGERGRGIDVTAAMIEQARELARERSLRNLIWRVAAIPPLPLEDDSFDHGGVALRVPPFRRSARGAARDGTRVPARRAVVVCDVAPDPPRRTRSMLWSDCGTPRTPSALPVARASSRCSASRIGRTACRQLPPRRRARVAACALGSGGWRSRRGSPALRGIAVAMTVSV